MPLPVPATPKTPRSPEARALRAYLPKLKRTVVHAAQHDFVGVWFVLWYLRDRFPGLGDEQLRRTVLRLVEDLLREGTLVAGMPQGNAVFVPWTGTPEMLVRRIERQWRKLGRDPKMHELVLFDAPAEGNAGPA